MSSVNPHVVLIRHDGAQLLLAMSTIRFRMQLYVISRYVAYLLRLPFCRILVLNRERLLSCRVELGSLMSQISTSLLSRLFAITAIKILWSDPLFACSSMVLSSASLLYLRHNL